MIQCQSLGLARSGNFLIRVFLQIVLLLSYLQYRTSTEVQTTCHQSLGIRNGLTVTVLTTGLTFSILVPLITPVITTVFVFGYFTDKHNLIFCYPHQRVNQGTRE